jgi:hypothetical protein
MGVNIFSPGDKTLYKPTEYLVDGLIPKGHPVMFFGDGGSLKSITTQHLGISIASEEVDTWMGKKIPTLPVLNLEYEQSKEEHSTRGLQIMNGLQITTPTIENLMTLECDRFNFWEVATLVQEWAEEECLGKDRDGVVILDSLGYALPGCLEDQGTAIMFYRDFLVPLKKAGVTPIIVHHQPKYSQVPYGSVYLVRNNFRSQWLLEDTGGSHLDTKTIRMRDTKRNYSGKKEDIHITGRFSDMDTPDGEKAIWVNPGSPTAPLKEKRLNKGELIIEYLKANERATREEISEGTGISLKTVQNRVSDLLNGSEVEVDEDKRLFVPTPKSSNPSDFSGNGNGKEVIDNSQYLIPTPSHRESGNLGMGNLEVPKQVVPGQEEGSDLEVFSGPELIEMYPKREYPDLNFKNPEGKVVHRVPLYQGSSSWVITHGLDDKEEGVIFIEALPKDRGVQSA